MDKDSILEFKHYFGKYSALPKKNLKDTFLEQPVVIHISYKKGFPFQSEFLYSLN